MQLKTGVLHSLKISVSRVLKTGVFVLVAVSL